MRKTLFPALLLAALLLVGCSADAEAAGLCTDMRTRLLSAQTLRMDAALTADLGDEMLCFSVRYEGSASGGTLTVTAPEAIAGLTAEADVDSGSLTCEGAVLAAGELTEDGLSPAEALPLMLRQWKTGYIDECGIEKVGGRRTFMIESRVSEAVVHRAWFDADTLLPVRGELISGGRTVLTCEFENVTVN